MTAIVIVGGHANGKPEVRKQRKPSSSGIGDGNDVVLIGFDAEPGARDHIVFTDVLPNQVTVVDSIASW
jgi:hypothetical protein